MSLARLNIFWFGVSFMWATVHSFLLPQLVDRLGGRAHNTLYGLLTFAGLLVAMLATPLSGALSDRTGGRWGRRRPWMIVGVGLAALCLLSLAQAQTVAALASTYLLLQLSSNVAHGPALALIPDCVPADRHGVASGVKSFFDMLAVVVAALTISRLLSGGSGRFVEAALAAVVLLLICLVITTRAAGEHETSSGEQALPVAGRLRLRAVYNLDLRRHGEYGRLLASRFAMLLAIYIVQAFAYYFVADAVEARDPSTVVGNLMSIIGISVMVAAYPSGYASERWGRRPLSVFSCVLVACGLLALSQVRTVAGISVLGAIIGLGMGVFSAVNWAWATDMVPPDEAGRYLGLSNLATAGSAAVARLFGPLIDLVNGPQGTVGYTVMFLASAAAAVCALAITLRLGREQHGVAAGGKSSLPS